MTPKLHFTPFIQIQSILMNFALGDVTIISGRSLLKSYRPCLSLLLVFWDFVRSLNFDVFMESFVWEPRMQGELGRFLVYVVTLVVI